jgi:hypothetical protein
MFTTRDPAGGDARGAERRTVTPEEIWAVVDATN